MFLRRNGSGGTPANPTKPYGVPSPHIDGALTDGEVWDAHVQTAH